MNGNKGGLLLTVTKVFSAAVCLYYFVYLIFCLAGFDSKLMCIFAALVMAMAALPVVFADRLKKKLGKAFNVMHIIFTGVLGVYVLSVIAFWGYICIDSEKTPDAVLSEYKAQDDSGENTVISVFGCRAYGMRPSITLRLRLDAAYQLLTQLPDAICIVSGGQGNNETASEAVVMKNYLVELGISEERIFTEAASHSTSENVRYTKALIEKLGFENMRVIGVSTSFHLPRIGLLSKRYGLNMELCSSPSPTVGHFYVSMIREYLSFIKMAFFDKAVIITRVT